MHKLKGASSYMAAGPLVQVTGRALKLYERGEFGKMMGEYPMIIEHCISVKKEAAKLIYERALNPPTVKSKSKKIVQEPVPNAPSDQYKDYARNVPLAKSYTLIETG